jgi:RsiW-degrading membrane proteinase PrsW (M82 family)
MSYALLIAFGVLPSLVWLVYYYRKDCHPEPKYLVTKVFLMGIILSPVAIILQLLFVKISQPFTILSEIAIRESAMFFFWAAFVEEAVKFYAVLVIALHHPAFDEPVDAMTYMIAAAMGFAAMENILVMFRVVMGDMGSGAGLDEALSIWALRFVGATLLHALSSALLGYFIAMSWFFRSYAKRLIIMGIIMASIFHFTFNMFLSTFDNRLMSLSYTAILLVGMAFLVSVLFDKIKERHTKNTAKLIKA